MSSAAKTLDLLSYFSTTRPEIGLSELCGLAGRDKATTYRHLQVLQEAGFLEQSPESRRYRLGPAVLRLAHTREKTVPRKSSAMPTLVWLAAETGETAHVSILSGNVLYPLAAAESDQHSTRAIIDIEAFPLHATASGLCALAFGPADLMDAALRDMARFTRRTITDPHILSQTVAEARGAGFGRTDRSFDDDIHSLAAPLFDQSGGFAGSISVASVATRLTPEKDHRIRHDLARAARKITRNWGGVIPDHVAAGWARDAQNSIALETAS